MNNKLRWAGLSDVMLILMAVVCFTIPTTMLSLGQPVPVWLKIASFAVFTAGFAFFVALKLTDRP